MWILSIDTATKVTGLALHYNGGLVAESYLFTGKTHSEQLMPMIKQILGNAGIDFADLGAVAAASGPGSFTGLRIGMATAKGIAQVRKIALVGVNTLDALAQNGLGYQGTVVPILDARKNEVYCAYYQGYANRIMLDGSYRAAEPIVIAEELLVRQANVMFVGDAVPVYRQLLQDILGSSAFFPPDRMSMPRASHVGALAVERLVNGKADNLFALKPTYIRQSEAEVTWAKKFGRRGCDSDE